MRGAGAQPGRDAHGPHGGVGGQVVHGPPVARRRHERLDHDRHPGGVRGRDGAGVRLEGGERPGVVEVDAQQGLGEVEAVAHDRLDVVPGEPVVHLEAGVAQAAAVHRPDDHGVVEDAEEGEVVDDVGGGEHAVHARGGERRGEPVEQGVAVGHRHRVGADAERAAGRVVRGDDEQAPVAAQQRAAAARRVRGGDGLGVLGPGGAQPVAVGGRQGAEGAEGAEGAVTHGYLPRSRTRPRRAWASPSRTRAATRRSRPPRRRTSASSPGPTRPAARGTARRRSRRRRRGR